MHLEKKTVPLQEKFSQLNFTIRSQLDKSINLTDPTMKNRADRRFEKGLRKDVSRASKHDVYSLSGVGHLCGEQSHTGTRLLTRAEFRT